MSQFSDWERDYGSPYDRVGARAEPSVLPIDVIEMAGSMVDSQVMTRHDAAVLVMGHVRVTYLGAMSLVSPVVAEGVFLVVMLLVVVGLWVFVAWLEDRR